MSPIHQVRSYCKPVWFAFLLLTGASTALAYEHFTIASASLGEGVFAYRLTLHDDPFSMYDDTFGFGVVATGVVSVTVTPPGWTASVSNDTVLWSSNIDITSSHMPRPASYDFGFQSSFASHRTNEMDATVYGSLMPFKGGGGSSSSINMVYYWSVPAVVPCAEELADGSAASHSETREFFPDVLIESFYVQNGERRGLNVRFDYSGYSAVVKAKHKLSDPWTLIGPFEGQAGLTTWIADQPLAQYGGFFRVALTSFPGLFLDASLKAGATVGRSALAAAASEYEVVPFRLTRPLDGSVRVSFDTETGVRYRVWLDELPKGASVERPVIGTGARVEVVFATSPASAAVRVLKWMPAP